MKKFFIQICLVGAGGSAGASARFLIGIFGRYIGGASNFYLGTFIANMLGCLLIGISFALIELLSSIGVRIRLFFITGFLGALTTFSSFQLDDFKLVRHELTDVALLNLTFQVLLGLVAVWAGYVLVRAYRKFIKT